MPWPETTVPKFGDWDNNEDLSYSIVFDKARAEKERYLHTFQEDENDRARYQNMLKNSEMTVGNTVSHAYHDERLGMRTRDPGDNTLKLPSGHAFLAADGQISRAQQNSNNLQVDSWNTSDGGPAYMTVMPSLVPMRQPMTMGAAKEGKLKESHVHTSGYHVDPLHEAYHGRLHSKPAVLHGPRRQMYQENPAAAKITRSHRNLESSRTADMPEKTVVPRFGDWDPSDASSGEGFTRMFSKARDEKSKYALKTTGKAISPLRPDEDLYKNSQASTGWKKQRADMEAEECKHSNWWRLLYPLGKNAPVLLVSGSAQVSAQVSSTHDLEKGISNAFVNSFGWPDPTLGGSVCCTVLLLKTGLAYRLMLP